MPQNQISVTPTNPQNINFQWAPRHNNVNDVEYEFTITDLMLNNGFQEMSKIFSYLNLLIIKLVPAIQF
jgi:hypothetical protein